MHRAQQKSPYTLRNYRQAVSSYLDHSHEMISQCAQQVDRGRLLRIQGEQESGTVGLRHSMSSSQRGSVELSWRRIRPPKARMYVRACPKLAQRAVPDLPNEELRRCEGHALR